MDAAEITSEFGVIRITDKVLAVIVQKACLSVDGIAAMDMRFNSPLSSRLIGEDAGGVHITIHENKASVSVYILAKYGLRIPEIALHAQECIKEALWREAEVSVSNVDVYIQGIVFNGESFRERG